MKNIAIFCGGVSAEHEISIISASNIIKALDPKYNPIVVLISRSGTWFVVDPKTLSKIKECSEPFDDGQRCTIIRKPNRTCLLTLDLQEIPLDVAFPIIHGPMGEDGTLQGLFEIMQLPYVGSGVLSSSIGMDKDVMKKLFLHHNIPSVPFKTLYAKDNYPDYETITSNLDSDILFVKPSVMGSSIGISKVTNKNNYDACVLEAFKYSSKVIVEKFIPGREIECAVLGYKDPRASALGEIIPQHDFYSYEAKYIDPDGAKLCVPAIIHEALALTIQDIAVMAFKAIECQGLARVDFFLSQNNEIFVNEINTLPGFTSISMYPKLWEYSGVSYQKLIQNLIDIALEAHLHKQLICLMPQNQPISV